MKTETQLKTKLEDEEEEQEKEKVEKTPTTKSCKINLLFAAMYCISAAHCGIFSEKKHCTTTFAQYIHKKQFNVYLRVGIRKYIFAH